MQAVFAGSAAMLFVPVLFHGQAPSAVGTVPAGTGELQLLGAQTLSLPVESLQLQADLHHMREQSCARLRLGHVL